jgi:hypothetical protein
MNANEMANELELKADRVSSFGSPGYEDEDLTSVLTEAENLFVKKFVDRKNNRKNESFDETEIRNQGLSALVKRGAALSASSSQVGVFANGTFFDLPVDFMQCIHEEIIVNKNQCGTDTPIEADVFVAGYDEVSRLRKNKYKKPYCFSSGEAKVWRLVFSREVDGDNPSAVETAKRHQVLTDGTFAVSSYSINYLRLPKGIVVDRDTPSNQRSSILDSFTHSTIIDIALSLLLDRVKEQRLSNIESFKDLE